MLSVDGRSAFSGSQAMKFLQAKYLVLGKSYELKEYLLLLNMKVYCHLSKMR